MTRLVCLVGVFLCATASAQDKAINDAKTYFEAGKQAYEAGDYLIAIRSFEQALKALPRPPIKFSLAQAYRKQYYIDRDAAKLKQAVRLYREYLQEVTQGGRREDATQYLGELAPQLEKMEAVRPVSSVPQMPAEKTQLMVMSRVKEAMASIDGAAPTKVPVTVDVKAGSHKIHVTAPGHDPEDLDGMAVEGRLVVVESEPRARPALLALRTNGGADVALDGRTVGSAPLSTDVPMASGKHYLTVTERGHIPYAKEITVDNGQTLTVNAPLERTGQRKIALWVLGGSGALLVGGGVTTLLAFLAQNDAQSILDKQMTQNLTGDDLQSYQDARSRRDTMVTASYVIFGAAAVVGITGALLYFVDNPRVEAAPSGGQIVPVATPDELGMAYVGRF